MKYVSLLVVFFFVSVSVFAQKRNDFTGPKHKNFKPWIHKKTPTLVYKNTNSENVKGPEFKNRKIWETKSEDLELITISKSKKSKLKGPKFKNHKPWDKV